MVQGIYRSMLLRFCINRLMESDCMDGGHIARKYGLELGH